MKNVDIRNKLKKSHIFQYELAEAMGMSEMTLLKKLRKEFSLEEKQKIYNIIDELMKGDKQYD